MDADGQDSTAAVPAWLNGSAPAATATAEPQLVETAEPHWLRRAFSSVIMHHEHPRDIAAARDRWELVRTHHVDATVMDWEERQRAPIGKQQQHSKDVEEEPEPDWLSQASVSILNTGKRARNSIAAMVLGEAKVDDASIWRDLMRALGGASADVEALVRGARLPRAADDGGPARPDELEFGDS